MFEKQLYTDFLLRACLAEYELQQKRGGNDSSKPVTVILQPHSYIGITELEEGYYLIYGPAVPYSHSQEEMEIYRKVPLYRDNFASMQVLWMGLNTASMEQFQNAFCTAADMLGCDIGFPKDQIVIRDYEMVNGDRKILSKYQFHMQEEGLFHTPESFEKGIGRAIMDGDMERLESILQTPVAGRIGRLSLDQGRQNRYMFVNTVAVMSRYAMRGGLNYEDACTMADAYCQRMDVLTRETDRQDLLIKMMKDACNQVAQVKLRDRKISPDVYACCEYVRKHLHEKVVLDDLAEVSGLSPNRISMKFKREMGIAVSDYINEQKMREAADLLIYSTNSISEISSFLDYGNQSYFTSIFQKIYHVTPREFRRKHGMIEKKKTSGTTQKNE